MWRQDPELHEDPFRVSDLEIRNCLSLVADNGRSLPWGSMFLQLHQEQRAEDDITVEPDATLPI